MTAAVHDVQPLTSSTFVLRFERGGIEFEPGQYVTVGVRGDVDVREYSVYSAPCDPHIEILVKEVSGGYVSPRLKGVQAGGELTVEGPFGFFTIDAEARENAEILFVATGTGISPFRSFVRSYENLSYRVLHGVRSSSELYAREVFDTGRYVSCVTGDDGGTFRGRVTDYLRSHPVASQTLCYLCGNCDMIYEAFDILQNQGVPPENLFAEVYF
jgi:ferredoxin--NADP+ reductase/benzoate/toluate 1,2-dioxygenase reductase subunit